MSQGISDKAPKHEKIFTEFADSIDEMNCCCEIDYSAYSKVFDLGRELADNEYKQGRADAIEEFLTKSEFMRGYKFDSGKLSGVSLGECLDEIAKWVNSQEGTAKGAEE